MTELEQLKEILEKDWKSFRGWRTYPEGWDVMAEIEDDQRRWCMSMRTIVKAPSGQLFAFDWDKGLTEYQEDACDYPDVRKVKAVTKTITTTEYPVVRD